MESEVKQFKASKHFGYLCTAKILLGVGKSIMQSHNLCLSEAVVRKTSF